MGELENLLIALFSNCSSESELFNMQVEMMKKLRLMKDKRQNELRKGV